MTCSTSQVEAVLTNISSWARVNLTDEDYVIPTEAWVKGTLTKHFNQFLFDYNVRVYVEGKNECDKFSLYARAIANALNRHNPKAGPAGIAFGEVFLLQGINGHAMNFAIVADESKKPKLVYYEPQVGQIVDLPTNNLVILSWHM